jgi:hypothetical protein
MMKLKQYAVEFEAELDDPVDDITFDWKVLLTTREAVELARKYADHSVAKKLIDMGYKDYVDKSVDHESELAKMELFFEKLITFE